MVMTKAAWNSTRHAQSWALVSHCSLYLRLCSPPRSLGSLHVPLTTPPLGLRFLKFRIFEKFANDYTEVTLLELKFCTREDMKSTFKYYVSCEQN
jgi:hypothetical protein